MSDAKAGRWIRRVFLVFFSAFLVLPFSSDRPNSLLLRTENPSQGGDHSETRPDKNETAGKPLNPTPYGIGGHPVVAPVGNDGHPPIRDAEEQERTQREKDDLKAQQDMAWWAMLMLIATVFTVGVTGLGVWYVRDTLKVNLRLHAAAVEANRQNREAMIAENRPWVLMESIEPLSAILWRGPYCDFAYKVIFRNCGSTPARYVNVALNQMIGPIDDVGIGVHRYFAANQPKEATVGETIIQGQEYERNYRVTFTKEGNENEDYGRLIIIVRIQYSTPFDNEIRQSRYAFHIIKKRVIGNVCIESREEFIPISAIGFEPYIFCEDYIT